MNFKFQLKFSYSETYSDQEYRF